MILGRHTGRSSRGRLSFTRGSCDSFVRWRALALAGLDQTGLVREHHALYAVAQAELHEHVRDVGLDGRLADEELRGDLGVREAPRDQLEHLELARRQAGEIEGKR